MKKEILAPVLGMLLTSSSVALAENQQPSNLEEFTTYVAELVKKQTTGDLSLANISPLTQDSRAKIMESVGLPLINIPSTLETEDKINVFKESVKKLGFESIPEERDDRYTYTDKNGNIASIEIDFNSNLTCTYANANKTVGFGDDNCDEKVNSIFYNGDNKFCLQSPNQIKVGKTLPKSETIQIN